MSREAIDAMKSALIKTQRESSLIADLFVQCVFDLIPDEARRRKINLDLNLAIERAYSTDSAELQTLLMIKQRFAERRTA